MGFSISLPFGSRGRAPRVTIYHRSGGCCSGIFGLVFIIAATVFCMKSCGPRSSTAPNQPPPKPAAEKITPTNNPQPKTAAEVFLATNEPARKLKQSIDEAKLALSANPAPIIEAATRAIVEEKTSYESLTFDNLEFRKHAEGRLLIQHFTIDGNHRRLGFLERTPGDFSDIAPSSLQHYIDESTPEQKSEPRDDPAVVEARKAKAARAYSKPLPDIREEIANRTREHAQNKLNPKKLTLLDLQRRTHKLGTVWIQRFNADGKTWRTGFLHSSGILSQIAPKSLQTYIDESTPED